MNRNYIKGRRAEYACMRELEKEHYECFRGAGSHGIDVVAFLILEFNPHQLPLVRAISVKSTRKGNLSKKALDEMRAYKFPRVVQKEVWHYRWRKEREIHIVE